MHAQTWASYSALVQLVKYDVHTTRKIKFIHAIFCHISHITSNFINLMCKIGMRSAESNENVVENVWKLLSMKLSVSLFHTHFFTAPILLLLVIIPGYALE